MKSHHAPSGDYCDVVGGGFITHESLHRMVDFTDDLVRAAASQRMQVLYQAIFTEFVVIACASFRHTIAEHHEQISRMHFGFDGVVPHALQNAQNRTTYLQGLHLTAAGA
jgi:hypothetical protein